MATKIISYNVNGLRSALSKDWLKWLKAANPDVICLQEIKCFPESIDQQPLYDLGYKTFWNPAKKPGYSGVALFCKKEPDHVEYGCGMKKYDDEGRIIRADFGKYSFMSTYFPSGSSGDERQVFKMEFLADFRKYITELRKKREFLVISGDVNICHKPIDIHNPVSNKNSSGFLPEEREWMDQFTGDGFVDCFREFSQEPHQYSWWSFRFNARAKNLGWRIDYNLATENLKSKLKKAAIFPDAKHSDHCPVMVEIDI